MNDKKCRVFIIGAAMIAIAGQLTDISVAQGDAIADCSRIQRWIASGAQLHGATRDEGTSG
jgi:hypothetical protein